MKGRNALGFSTDDGSNKNRSRDHSSRRAALERELLRNLGMYKSSKSGDR